MLVLDCAEGEAVMIGDDIMVTFVGYYKGHAKLSFDAPKRIPIHREKIYNRIKKHKEVQETKKPQDT